MAIHSKEFEAEHNEDVLYEINEIEKAGGRVISYQFRQDLEELYIRYEVTDIEDFEKRYMNEENE